MEGRPRFLFTVTAPAAVTGTTTPPLGDAGCPGAALGAGAAPGAGACGASARSCGASAARAAACSPVSAPATTAGGEAVLPAVGAAASTPRAPAASDSPSRGRLARRRSALAATTSLGGGPASAAAGGRCTGPSVSPVMCASQRGSRTLASRTPCDSQATSDIPRQHGRQVVQLDPCAGDCRQACDARRCACEGQIK